MEVKCRSGPGENKTLDRDLEDVLIAISITSRSIAEKIRCAESKKIMKTGGQKNGKGGNIIITRCRT